MSTEHQDDMRIRQRELIGELAEFMGDLTSKSNKHRVYLAWKRIRAIKISAEVKE